MQRNGLKVQKSERKKAGFQSIVATIRTRRESRYLPYAGFFFGQIGLLTTTKKLIVQALYIGVKTLPKDCVHVKCVSHSMSGFKSKVGVISNQRI